MGISVSFYSTRVNRPGSRLTSRDWSESSSMCYSTMASILRDLCFFKEADNIQEESCFRIDARTFVQRAEVFFSRNPFYKEDCKEGRFVRQILAQYNDFVKAGGRARWFGGA